MDVFVRYPGRRYFSVYWINKNVGL